MTATNGTNAATLNAKIAATIEQLATATDAARAGEQLQKFLEFSASFHRYSWNNTMLIWLAKPDATLVAGYNAWLKKHRYVRRGEKGIPILAPCAYRVASRDPATGEPTAETAVFFKTVYVFDISQTDGEPLPQAPDWRSPARSAELETKLLDFAASKGIAVTVTELTGQTQGTSYGGRIELSPTAGVKTFIHELAHELMHQANRGNSPRDLMELEAESVAYVVARHFGIDGLNCPTYLALWGADAAQIRASFARIQKTAAEIISHVEGAEPETTE